MMKEQSYNSNIRIAVLGSGFVGWGGGIDFICIVLNGLLAQKQNEKSQVFLFLPANNFIAKIHSLLGTGKRLFSSVVAGQPYAANTLSKFDDEALTQSFADYRERVKILWFSKYPTALSRKLTANKIDVIVPSFVSLGYKFSTPWVGYIADLQHCQLPELFSTTERDARDKMYKHILSTASAVIVNSKAVCEDIQKFYPGSLTKLVPLPFAPMPQNEWFERDVELVRNHYALPKKYFMISNQFWMHKDHSTAFRAFKLFLDSQNQRSQWRLVCTGKAEDYRSNKYIQDLLALIDSLSLKEAIIFLGYVSKLDQISLMRGAVAVIQPTLFEGGPGGGAVYDAVSVGTPVIVTDIPVNREIESKTSVRFFTPSDVDSLAKQMIEESMSESPRLSSDVLIELGRQRMSRLGDALSSAIVFARNDFVNRT